jgi:hypothetical protein
VTDLGSSLDQLRQLLTYLRQGSVAARSMDASGPRPSLDAEGAMGSLLSALQQGSVASGSGPARARQLANGIGNQSWGALGTVVQPSGGITQSRSLEQVGARSVLLPSGSVLSGLASDPLIQNGPTTAAWAYPADSQIWRANGNSTDGSAPLSAGRPAGHEQVAQELMFAAPPDEIIPTPEGMTPLEELPAGSAGGKGAGKPFPRSLNDKPEGTPCQYCGTPTTREPGPDRYNGDHNIPRSQGGNRSPENHIDSCRDCNLGKGPRTPGQWYRDLLGLTNRT